MEEIGLYLSKLRPATWDEFEQADKYDKFELFAIDGLNDTALTSKILALLKAQNVRLNKEIKAELVASKVNPEKAKKALNTYLRYAYSVHNCNIELTSDCEYLRYSSFNCPCKTHEKAHGILLHRDHSFWAKNYPPNTMECQCHVDAYVKEELEARDWKVSENVSMRNMGAVNFNFPQYFLHKYKKQDEEIEIVIKIETTNKTKKPKNKGFLATLLGWFK